MSATKGPVVHFNAFQRELERIYEVAVPHDVDDFVISDEALARHLGQRAGSPHATEQLFVREAEDALDISLYIAEEVVERLSRDDPIIKLHGGNLGDFCTALEGVSHFLYLTWNARHAREVSALELELQAEVDKYFVSTFLFSRQRDGDIPDGLGNWLFDSPCFDARLDEATRRRYEEANYYAARFCAELEHRYLREKRSGNLINELRRFYRLTRWQKIDRIARRGRAGGASTVYHSLPALRESALPRPGAAR